MARSSAGSNPSTAVPIFGPRVEPQRAPVLASVTSWFHNRDHQLRGIPLRVVHDVVRDDTTRLVVVVAARVQVAVEAGEVAAAHLDPQPMPDIEIDAGGE